MTSLTYVPNKNRGYRGLRVLKELEIQGVLKIVGIVTDSKLAKQAEHLKPDWGVCEGCGDWDCSQIFFSIPHRGFLNIHLSLLPKYRGVWPVIFAVINDEKMTGVTIHFLDGGINSGNIVAQEAVPIFEDDTGYDVYHRLLDLAERMMRQEMPQILLAPKVLSFRQDEERASVYTNKAKLKKASLSWERKKLYDFARAFDFPPYEPAYVFVDGKKQHLLLRPERHEINGSGLDSISYNGQKIYMLEGSKYNHMQGI